MTCVGTGGSASSSASVAVTPAPPSAGSYTTSFDLTENPISEGGRWARSQNAFTDVRTENGIAHGTNGITNSYDDSYALLSGYGPDYSAEAVIYRSPSLATGTTHEIELLLRFSDNSGNAQGYECLFAYYGGVALMRWNGPFGDFTPLATPEGSGGIGRELVSGDVVKATIVGNVISMYINGTLVARGTDSTFATGQPGIAFFTRPGGNSAHFGLTSYSIFTN